MRLWTERNHLPSLRKYKNRLPSLEMAEKPRRKQQISVLPPPDMVYENRVEYTSGLVYRVPLVLVSKAEGVESP